MSHYGKTLNIISHTFDQLNRTPRPVADAELLRPHSSSKVPLIAGEFVTDVAGKKYDRATDPTKPAYLVIEDCGDTGVQASGKVSAVRGFGYEADTLVFTAPGGGFTLGQSLMIGTVSINGKNHTGLVAHTGTNRVIGHVVALPSENNGYLRFLCTGV